MASKFGVWINHTSEDAGKWKCSSCEHEVNVVEGSPLENNMERCPACGAKMMGETRA